MKQIVVNLKERSYPIHIGAALLPELGKLAQSHGLERSIAVITDHTVREIYGDLVEQSLRIANFYANMYSVPPGEASKSLDVVESLIGELIKDGFTRQTTIIALGGGVVGDLAGFIAATYLRGVDYVQVPTTLLAQVDSSVGGKVGVNHPLGKNLIGAFLQPKFVLIDPTVLNTLPKRELKAGLAEVIKYGLIKDKNLFDDLEERLESLSTLSDAEFLISCIEKCCRIKADIVERDEKETGERRILNFGHTIGHALEAVTGYDYFRHGEAVAWGMQAVAWLSHLAGGLSQNDSERISAVIARLKAPAIPERVSPQQIIEAIGHDKKQTSTGLKWVLLRGIGDGFVSELVDQSVVEETVMRLLTL